MFAADCNHRNCTDMCCCQAAQTLRLLPLHKLLPFAVDRLPKGQPLLTLKLENAVLRQNQPTVPQGRLGLGWLSRAGNWRNVLIGNI